MASCSLMGRPAFSGSRRKAFPMARAIDSLFSIAVYFRKKNPDGWQDDVVQFNIEHMDPPLSNGEVQSVIKIGGQEGLRIRMRANRRYARSATRRFV